MDNHHHLRHPLLLAALFVLCFATTSGWGKKVDEEADSSDAPTQAPETLPTPQPLTMKFPTFPMPMPFQMPHPPPPPPVHPSPPYAPYRYSAYTPRFPPPPPPPGLHPYHQHRSPMGAPSMRHESVPTMVVPLKRWEDQFLDHLMAQESHLEHMGMFDPIMWDESDYREMLAARRRTYGGGRSRRHKSSDSLRQEASTGGRDRYTSSVSSNPKSSLRRKTQHEMERDRYDRERELREREIRERDQRDQREQREHRERDRDFNSLREPLDYEDDPYEERFGERRDPLEFDYRKK